jgi:hypothetical protein
MLELSLLDGFAVDMLRLVAWANVGVAAALLVAIGVWLVCCGIESRSHPEGGK